MRRSVFELTRSRFVGSIGRSTGTGSAFLGSSSVAITARSTSGPTIRASTKLFSFVNLVTRIPVPPRPLEESSSNGVTFADPVSVTVTTAPSPIAAPAPTIFTPSRIFMPRTPAAFRPWILMLSTGVRSA